MATGVATSLPFTGSRETDAISANNGIARYRRRLSAFFARSFDGRRSLFVNFSTLERAQVFGGEEGVIYGMGRIAFVLGLALSLSLFGTPVEASDLTGRASVIDGDTIEIRGQRIRLYGIDAPESGQLCKDAGGKPYRCGQVAALALDEKIGSTTVRCEQRDVDRYGRAVAICRVGDVDLGAWMINQGLAVEYRKYSGGRYRNEESEAKAARLGLWAGAFVWPWEWRRHVR